MEILSISPGSFTIAATVYGAFLTLEKHVSDEAKQSLYQWIVNAEGVDHTSILHQASDIANSLFDDGGYSVYSFLKNSLITLCVFVGLLIFFNTTNLLFGEDGVLISESGEIDFHVSSAEIETTLSTLLVSLEYYLGNFAFVGYVLIPFFVLVIVLLIPSYLAALVTVRLANISDASTKGIRIAAVYLVDIAIKAAILILYSTLLFTLMGQLIDDATLFNNYNETLSFYLDGILFQEENTVVPALFYACLYVNLWYLLFFGALLISKLLLLSRSGSKLLQFLKIKSQPLASLGIIASVVTFIGSEAGIVVTSPI